MLTARGDGVKGCCVRHVSSACQWTLGRYVQQLLHWHVRLQCIVDSYSSLSVQDNALALIGYPGKKDPNVMADLT